MRSGVHGRGLTFVKRQANGSVFNHKPNFRAIHPAVSELRKGGGGHICTCIRAHVQMYPTHDLCCIMHRGFVSKRTHQILRLSAYPFLSYSLPANFYTPSVCRCHVPHCLSTLIDDVGSIHGRGDVAFPSKKTACQNDPLLQKCKLVKSATGSCRAGPLILKICPLFTKELRSALHTPLVIIHT